MVAAAVVCLAIIPAASAAGLAPPAPGAWKLHNINAGAPEVKSGSFTVTPTQYVTGFRLTLGSGAESPCGTGNITVKVLGEQQLLRNPMNDLNSPSNEYAISPANNVTRPVSVIVTVTGKRQGGQLEIAFGPGTVGGSHTAGDLYYKNGNCDIAFGVTKG
jgi:hypothetical protein